MPTITGKCQRLAYRMYFKSHFFYVEPEMPNQKQLLTDLLRYLLNQRERFSF